MGMIEKIKAKYKAKKAEFTKFQEELAMTNPNAIFAKKKVKNGR